MFLGEFHLNGCIIIIIIIFNLNRTCLKRVRRSVNHSKRFVNESFIWLRRTILSLSVCFIGVCVWFPSGECETGTGSVTIW